MCNLRKNMVLFFKKKYFLIFVFLLVLFITRSFQKRENKFEDFPNKYVDNQSINLTNLKKNLFNADKKLTPKLIRKNDGSTFYTYIKKPGEGEISLEEIKERILLGPDFYKNDRDNVIILLKRINQLKINNQFKNIDSGALGLWIPSQDTIVIDYRVIEMGSSIFLEVLSHEVIHVAQSCFNGSRNNFPKRIGLPLEYSKDLNMNLDHKLYSKKSEDVINLEREAFTYSKVKGVAIGLLNNFCK